jgi:hypothetical protein
MGSAYEMTLAVKDPTKPAVDRDEHPSSLQHVSHVCSLSDLSCG